MRHEQTMWDKFIGRMVIEVHTARRSPTKSVNYIDIQTYRYSECPWIRFLQFLHIDKRGWFRELAGSVRVNT